MPLSPPDMSQVRRLLIVKLSAIGDVVHSLPVSAALSQAFPHIEISWVVEATAAPVLQNNPHLQEIIVVPRALKDRRPWAASARELARFRRELRERRFDIALDLHGLSKSALVTRLSGARRRYGYDWLREVAPLLLDRVPRREESVHVVDQYLDVARFLGARPEKVVFPLSAGAAARERSERLLAEVGIEPSQPFIAINPTAGGWGYKGLDAERLARLINGLAEAPSLPLVLVGGEGDAAITEETLRLASVRAASLVGQTSLLELVAVLERCALHVAGDTGSAHIAAAVGKPVVTFFGRTNPDRLAPYGYRHFVVEHREQCKAVCRRFHETAPVNSKQKCLAEPPSCLEAIDPAEVVEMARKAMLQPEPRLPMARLPAVRVSGGGSAKGPLERICHARKILVVSSFTAIGDAILETPFLRGLRGLAEKAEIVMMGGPALTQLFRNSTSVDRVWPVEGGHRGWARREMRLLPQLKAEKFDAVFLLYRSPRSAVMAWLAGIPVRVGFDIKSTGRFLTVSVPYDKSRQSLECCLDLLRVLGVPDPSPRTELWVTESEREDARALLMEAGLEKDAQFVGMAPASTSDRKQWPVERFAEAANRLAEARGAAVVLLGTTSEADVVAECARAIRVPCANLAGRTSLRNAHAIVSLASLWLSNDGSLLHAAVALGIPSVGIYAPAFVERFGYRLAGHRSLAFVPERPPKDVFAIRRCLEQIAVEEVVDAAETVLKERALCASRA